MEHYGSDFNAKGSVMSRAELEDQRRKRGECVRCGQKCFQKKLFKMIPITEHGKVQNGRCLNCNPLDGTNGAIPAVARPATQADLKRFSKSQNVLRSSSSHTSASRPSSRTLDQRRAVSQSHSLTSEPGRSRRTQKYEAANKRPTSSSSSQGGAPRPSRRPGSSARSDTGSVVSSASERDSYYARGDRSTDGEVSVVSSVGSAPSRGAIGAHITGRSSESIQSTPSMGLPPQPNNRGTDTGIYPPSAGGISNSYSGDRNSSRSIGRHSDMDHSSGRRQVVMDDDDVDEFGEDYSQGPHGYPDANGYDDDYDGKGPSVENDMYGGIERAPPRNYGGDRQDLDYYQRSTHGESPRGGHRSDSDHDAYPRSDSSHHRRGRASSRDRDMDGLGSSVHSRSYHNRGGYGRNDAIPSGSMRGGIGRNDPIPAGSMRGGRPSESIPAGSMRGGRSNSDREFGRYPRSHSLDNSVTSFSGEDDEKNILHSSSEPNLAPVSGHDTSSNHRVNDDFHDDNYEKSFADDLHHSFELDVPPRPDENTSRSPQFIASAIQRLRDFSDDYREILHVMKDHPDVPQVQSLGMQMISNMQLSDRDCDDLADLGAIQIITDAMRAFENVVELQICGCRAMWNASFTPGNQLAFVDNGALEILLHQMGEHQNDDELIEQALSVLANLGAAEENLDIIVEKGAIPRMVESMSKHINRVNVQMRGCLAFANLASHTSDLKQTILQMGAGSAIVICMVMHPADPDLQERALRALRNLSANCDENRIEITNIGGIDAIVSAMQVHRDVGPVQEAGSWTLSNLAGNPNTSVLIGECGGVDVIIRAMWVHPGKPSVLEWCARALFTLSLDPRNKQMILDVGGISAVVSSMQTHTDSPPIQEIGCAVLCNLATDQPSKMRIVDEEALDAVVLAMVLHCEDEQVQQRACQLCLQLCIAENFKAMQACNAGELVRAAGARFPEACGETADRLTRVIESFLQQYL